MIQYFFRELISLIVKQAMLWVDKRSLGPVLLIYIQDMEPLTQLIQKGLLQVLLQPVSDILGLYRRMLKTFS
jgi:hypothetical protein